MYNDIYIDPHSSEAPITGNVGFSVFAGSRTLKKEVLVLLKEVSFTTDTGLLFPDRTTSNYVGV